MSDSVDIDNLVLASLRLLYHRVLALSPDEKVQLGDIIKKDPKSIFGIEDDMDEDVATVVHAIHDTIAAARAGNTLKDEKLARVEYNEEASRMVETIQKFAAQTNENAQAHAVRPHILEDEDDQSQVNGSETHVINGDLEGAETATGLPGTTAEDRATDVVTNPEDPTLLLLRIAQMMSIDQTTVKGQDMSDNDYDDSEGNDNGSDIEEDIDPDLMLTLGVLTGSSD